MRNLLNRSFEVLGVDQKIWLSLETGGYGMEATGGTLPVGAGAVEHINANIKFDIPREDSAARSGRSLVTRLSGKKTVEIAWESYVIPGTPDVNGYPTLPPCHPLFLSAFGNIDLTDPTKIIYLLSRLNDKTFRMLEEATHYSRLAVGCVAEKLTFQLPGDGKAMINVEGFGQDVFAAGEAKLAQALTGAAVAASRVIQDLTYTADNVGSNGNLITITYTGGGTAGAEVVTVVGNAISVQIESGVSTALQIKTAVDASLAAAALVNVAITGVGGNAQVTAAAVNLQNGLLATELKVEPDQGQLFEVGMPIDVIAVLDGNTVSNSAKMVTAKGTGVNKDIIQVSTALAAALVGDFVIGHAPASYDPISSENALLGLKGSFSVVGYTIGNCELISAEISITNNFTKKDFIYGTSRICGYIPDKRRNVGVKIEVLLNRDNFAFYMRNKQFVAEDMTITLEPQDIPAPMFSSSAGRTFKFHMPRVEFNIPPIEQPGDKYVTLSLEGFAMASDNSTTDDELVLTIE